MKKRERRRYLTLKYQQRQVRLANRDRGYRPYDSQRFLQRPLAIRQRFYDELAGRYVGPQWTDRERRFRTEYMLGCDITPFTDKELGRFRNHSFRDCGRPRCHMCGNPRRNSWWKTDRVTLKERINKDVFEEDIKLYREGEYDE